MCLDYGKLIKLMCLSQGVDIWRFIADLGDADVYLKLDVEGSEYQMLRNLISRGFITHILISTVCTLTNNHLFVRSAIEFEDYVG